MEAAVSVSDLLRRYVSDAQTAFSVGSFGALAGFNEDPMSPVSLIWSISHCNRARRIAH